MADHQERDSHDVVETVSVRTGTSASDADYATPLGQPATDDEDAAVTTPKAEKHAAAGEYFNPTTEAEATPKAQRVKDVEVAAAPAFAAPALPATEPVREPLESSKSKSSDTGSEDKPRDQEADLEKGESLEETKGDGAEGKDTVAEAEAKEVDPNIVDWDGPDDPAKGVNWKNSKKWSVVGTLSLLTFISPLASSMFAPGVPEVLEEFQVSGIYLESFVVSVYILGYAAGPIVIAPLSELYGRSILYNCTNVLFIIFTVACALSTSMGMLIGFRFLAGIAGSAVLTMGAGTLSDLFIQEHRGRAMAIWASGPLIGPVAGPVAGGFLAQAKGWRWVFWVIAMGAAFCAILMFLVLSETYAPIILERKTEKLRKETGNPNLKSAMDSGLSPRDAFKRGIFRPLKMLIYSPIVALLTVYNSVVYGYLYLVFTTITEVFESGYHFSQGVVGLTFLGIGVGMFMGLLIFGGLSDALLKRRAKQGEMKPEYRLPPMVFVSVLIPIGLFIYGWTAEKLVFWFWPIFGTSFIGFGLIGVFMCIQTYLVDAYTLYAASAIAANTIFRSLVGALLPLAGPSLYANLGLGWGNSLLGFIAVALIPIPYLFYKYGERIRTSPRFQPNW